jgi:hypothetical protein
VIECLLGNGKVLNSNPSISKKKILKEKPMTRFGHLE